MRFTRAIPLAIAGALLFGSVVAPSPAYANTSEGFIAGAGTVTDDFNDEGPLSISQNSVGGAVGLWQMILMSEGLYNDFDCVFGPNTRDATKAYQRRYGLTADGVVGPNTFKKAGSKLYISNGIVYYNGPNSDPWWTRSDASDHAYRLPVSGILTRYQGSSC